MDTSVVDALFLGEAAYDIILTYIDMFIDSKEPKSEFEEFIQSDLKSSYKSNIDMVFEYAESPIEKIFLNALLMQNLFSSSYLIIYTHPIRPANQELAFYRGLYESTMQFWQDFQEATGEVALDKFLSFVSESPYFNKEDKSILYQYLLYQYSLKHCNAFHFSLQCTFDDIQINGKCIRPDIFVWIPSKPDFRLIIECDGYKYHSDQKAFTNDRERDRKLKSMGFQVFRFSGQEINADPIGKAEELHNYLTELQFEMFHDEILEDRVIFGITKTN